ncbi:hypothetical protein HDU87_008692 [Geranomyces variabilis]|uniref:Uncharacterized protein n=1 Tax=Geranomyces variabilis TaxID=109894 RepID=A0AAD5TCH6_9FUNG|nr:hypothetical protein HDU87_008692 [Geranomyces variabilis]
MLLYIYLLVLPTDPVTIISGITAARACTPVDPTRINSAKAAKFLKATWLPPIRYPDQEDDGDGDGSSVAYAVARGKFPHEELARAMEAKVHLKNNPHARFILAYRDKADLADQRIRAEEEILRRLALNPEIPLQQRKIRPLTRDPNFAAQIKALSMPTKPNHFKPAALLRAQTVVTMPADAVDDAEAGDDEIPAAGFVSPQALLLPAAVRSVSKLPVPSELADAKAWMQRCVVYAPQKWAGAESEDAVYAFGRPSGVDDDVFTKAFREVSRIGQSVHDSSAAAGAETRRFELQPEALQVTDDEFEDAASLAGSLSRLSQLDIGTAPLPAIPRAVRSQKNPLKKHTNAFGATSLTSSKNITSLLHQRTDHRLHACQHLSTMRGVYKLVDMDRKRIEKTPGASVVWDGVVPYLWFPNALTLVRERARARHRRSMARDPRSAVAGSDTAGSAAARRRGVGGRMSLVVGGGGGGGGAAAGLMSGADNAAANTGLSSSTVEEFWNGQ